MSEGGQHGEENGGRLRVLVVEDEALVAMLMEDMIAALDHRVIGPVGRVAEAIEIVRHGEQVDCAILDLNLNGERALGVADALTERRIPFIFATGYGGEQLGGRFGGVPILQKPFQMADLRQALAQMRQRIAA
jgi:CheY-like chemotaxis protein